MNIAKAWTAQLDDYAIDLAWSPDGRLLAAASAAGPISVFDANAGTRRRELAGHADGSNALAWAPAPISDFGSRISDCPILASGGQDGRVRFWDAASGAQIAEAGFAPGSWVESVAWRPTAGNPQSGIRNPKSTMPAADAEPRRAKDNPPYLAAASGRTLVLLGADGTVVHTFPDAPKTLSALAWHPGGGAVAVAWFGGVRIWDADDFQPQREYAYGGAVVALTWAPDGRWLVAGAQDKAVHLWIPEEEQEFHMSGYETKVGELSFSADSRWLATGGARDACVWDCSGAGPEGREPVALPHSDRVCAVAYQHRRALLATAAGDGEVGLWDPTRPQPLVAAVKLTAPASRLAWSPDDARLAIGSQQGGLMVLAVTP